MDAVLNWLWQGSVVAAVLSVMLRTLTRARANVRFVVCWAAALFVLALPALPALLPMGSIEGISVSDNDAIVALPGGWWTSTRVILGAAALWVGISIMRVMSAIAAIRHARRRSRPFPAHLQAQLPHWRQLRTNGRRATLVLSNSVTSAAVVGWGAPLIAVAPSLVRTLEPDDLDRVLIHEWAHVQRRDDILNILQVLVCVVGGWHPALWWIDRRLQVEREVACDEMTVALTGSPKSYAECLMKLSARKTTPRAIQTAPAFFTSSGLGERVVKIVSPRQPIATIWSRAISAAVILVLCLLSVAVGGMTLVEATAFAEPVLSAATLTRNIPVDRPADTAVSSNVKAQPPRRRTTTRAPSPRRPTTEQPVSAAPATPQSTPSEPAEPIAAAPIPATAPPHATEIVQESKPPVEPDTVVVGAAPPPERAVTPDSPRSPWSAAASGGAAIGRKSKDAGVETAGLFTRFARRVAGSF